MTGLAISLIVLAVIIAIVGLVVEALQWLLIIAGVLLVLGLARAFAGRIQRGGTRKV